MKTSDNLPAISSKTHTRLERLVIKGKWHFALYYGLIYGAVSGVLFILSTYLISGYLTPVLVLINLATFIFMGIPSAFFMWYTLKDSYHAENTKR